MKHADYLNKLYFLHYSNSFMVQLIQNYLTKFESYAIRNKGDIQFLGLHPFQKKAYREVGG